MFVDIPFSHPLISNALVMHCAGNSPVLPLFFIFSGKIVEKIGDPSDFL
jgi:hypothetical protein